MLEVVYLSPEELTPYEGNARKHDIKDVEQIKESIRLVLNIEAPVLEPTAKRAGFSMNHEKLNGFYKTKAWEKCRKVYIQSTNGLCERCLGLGIYNAGKIVHHKIPLTESNYQDAAISLNPDNLMLLCHACHEEIHKGKGRFMWTADGRLIE